MYKFVSLWMRLKVHSRVDEMKRSDKMQKVNETSLVLRKETKFDKIRNVLLSLFLSNEDFKFIQRIDNLITPKRPENKQIIIPNETRPPMAQRNAYERNENKNEKYKRL